MYTHHKFDHEFDATVETRVSYVVCAVPRSGSSLLCELLCLTGLAGAPTEFFDTALMAEFSRAWGTTNLDAYVQVLMSKKTSANGVFGIKAHYPQLETALEDRDPDELFPNIHFLYVKRNDRLGQAVSYSRALQTGRWASDHQTQNVKPVFRPEQIRRLLDRIAAHEESWECFFARRGVTPLRVFYEDLVDSSATVVEAIMRFIGVDLPPGFAHGTPTLEKQADEVSEEWTRRFRLLDPAGTAVDLS